MCRFWHSLKLWPSRHHVLQMTLDIHYLPLCWLRPSVSMMIWIENWIHHYIRSAPTDFQFRFGGICHTLVFLCGWELILTNGFVTATFSNEGLVLSSICQISSISAQSVKKQPTLKKKAFQKDKKRRCGWRLLHDSAFSSFSLEFRSALWYSAIYETPDNQTNEAGKHERGWKVEKNCSHRLCCSQFVDHKTCLLFY